ncbi:hypothetical protein NliqN6_5155 [Naganishia liquefaciens]|uniref:Multicopper oxidase domain-containing protein n=1 Tax=Naganishia liquefaciens TaxID=104408 RepID=A0A8H3TX81_9TREE|nr:hypothetical protein NliqN6_5155 [Naganishia liquefaciens]
MRLNTLSTVAAAVGTAGIAQAAVVDYYWNITYATANPDKLFERRVIGVNGTWPPPMIQVNQNDTVRVHAYNGLGDQSTALHTHGIYFNNTGYYDGPIGVTQCGIPPGESLTYEVPVDLQHGTYWIHGHKQGQYADGLRAPFVITPAEQRTDITWDDEYTVVVGDWYHQENSWLVKNEFLTWSNPTGAEPVPKSAVIYVAHNGQYMNTQAELSVGTGVNDEAVLNFEAGKKYRIRIINMSALSMFHLAMEGHDMQVIELDGVEVEPFTVDELSISAAQRYSLLVEAKNETDKNYAFMAFQNTDMYDVVPDDLVLNNTLSIQYSASAPAPAAFNLTDSFEVTNETSLVPIVSQAIMPHDVNYTFVITFDTYDNGEPRAAFNDITYQMPKVPSLFSLLSMGEDASLERIYGTMSNAVTIKHLDVIQLTLVNTDTGFHPFHLHGHEFQVVNKAMDYLSNDTELNPPIDESQVNPVRRDTVTVPPGGSTTIRWRADNPGAWLFHCHVDWHHTQGLASVFIEAPDVAQQRMTLPSVLNEQCAKMNMPYSGNVVGFNSTSNFKGEPYGPWPQVLNWTTKAKGAMAGCVLTALFGLLSIVWYGWGNHDEEDIAEEIKRKQEIKAAKGGKFGALKSKVARSSTQ